MITVLRLGHRQSRDARVSTHLALTARAFGAEAIVYDASARKVADSVERIRSAWGGEFKVEQVSRWRRYVEEFDGVKVHLTMYGLPLDDVVPRLKTEDRLLVIVGGAKVPSEVYGMVDYNVAVGSQPHSEVAALACFLDRLTEGKALWKDFRGRKKIVPQARGKKVVDGSP